MGKIDGSPIFTGQVYFSRESFSCELLEVIKEKSEMKLHLDNGP